MPLVRIVTKVHVPNQLRLDIRNAIQEIVARALTCSDLGGSLTSVDIDVELDFVGEYDLIKHDIAITVTANDFPSRKKNHHDRRRYIQREVDPMIPEELTGFVWLLLSTASYGEFHDGEEAVEEKVPSGLPDGWETSAHPFLSTPLEEVTDLSPFARNRLASAMIVTVRDLLLARNEDIHDVQWLRGIKSITYKRIIEAKEELQAQVIAALAESHSFEAVLNQDDTNE